MRHRRELIVLAALIGALCAPAPAGAAERVLVGFDKGVSKDRQGKIVDRLGGRIEKRFSAVRGGRLVAVNARGGRRLDALRKVLRKAAGVTYAEPDFTLATSATRVPNDPDYPFQYAVANSATGAISAPAAWGTRTSCSTVAVLDTGIDTDHPDLAPNIYKSSDKPNNGKDDDKNGYVDDTYGLNVIKGKGSGEDDNGHGSHVAGIVGGRGNNGTGVSGICWSTKLMAVKFMNSKGKGSTSDAIDGIQYAAKKGAKVINCSFGSSSKSSAAARRRRLRPEQGLAAGGGRRQRRRQHRQEAGVPGLLHGLEHPDRGRHHVDRHAGLVLQLRVDRRGRGRARQPDPVDLPGRRLQAAVGYLDGLAVRRGHGGDAAQAGVQGHLLGPALRHPAQGGHCRPPLKGKVAYGGRLNAAGALGAIGSLAD